MTYIFDDPATFAEDALDGFCDAHGDLVRKVNGGAIRRGRAPKAKVAVIFGGGSGHYPAFAGLVGPGLADGAVCGNIFTSPSMRQAITVAQEAHYGRGVVFSYGNYAGDVMNFSRATERLTAAGIPTENVIVTDDIASAPIGQEDKRRGIAGDFTVYKVLGASAERGDDLAEVVRLGRKANTMTRTIGVAFDGCTFPGAETPLFTLKKGYMGLGLGIHGEPGLAEVPLPLASELGALLVAKVLGDVPANATSRVAVILNGLGSTKLEELFVLWKTIAPKLRESGLTLIAPEVGELVTSLDMAGTSLTLMYLDDELEELWLAPALSPAFQRGQVLVDQAEDIRNEVRELHQEIPMGLPESHEAAMFAVRFLRTAQRTIHEAESYLGEIDAIAGDGDHGRGMVRGIDAAVTAAEKAVSKGAGLATMLELAGDSWADQAGGTSGVLWGEGIRSFGSVLGDETRPTSQGVADAVAAFVERVIELGGAEVGDKTMVDSLVPFAHSFRERIDAGDSLAAAWIAAARDSTQAAENTKTLPPKKGRARPLAQRSLGTPDPGATSLAMILTAIGSQLRGGES